MIPIKDRMIEKKAFFTSSCLTRFETTSILTLALYFSSR